MGKEVGLCLMAGRLDSVAAAGERESLGSSSIALVVLLRRKPEIYS